jgi:hypothetical protein
MKLIDWESIKLIELKILKLLQKDFKFLQKLIKNKFFFI